MDPLTLFALANGAVSAVKAGCKLYKDIKGAAGEVKDVLKDLDAQFQKLYPADKPPTPEQKRQFVEEKNRVKELNQKANAGLHDSIYREIGEHLGTYYDNFYKCIAVFEEEERRAKTELYIGEASLGKRALQRVLMRKQLEQMGTELQEIMIYQSPPELGALWTEINAMMKQIGKEQSVLIAKQLQRQAGVERRRQLKLKRLKEEFIIGIAIITIIFATGGMFLYVIYDRQQKYPQYGYDLLPKNPNKKEEKYIYIGR